MPPKLSDNHGYGPRKGNYLQEIAEQVQVESCHNIIQIQKSVLWD